MNGVIIAPTIQYSRKSLTTISSNDLNNGVIIKDKFSRMVPKGTDKAPKDFQAKRYHNMQAIRKGGKQLENLARADFVKKEILENKKNMTSYPDTQKDNVKFIKGISYS